MRKFYFLLIAVIFAFSGNSQVANYSFAASSGTYTALTSPTNVFTSGWDDNSPVSVPIGFSFSYNGTAYTSVFVHSNGFISFGSALTSSTYTPISSTATAAGVVSAWGRDLSAQTTAPLGSVDYLSSGGVFTVQWSNARRYVSTTNAERFEMQIRLIQSTGAIQIVYGTWSNAIGGTASNGEVGIRGAANTDFKNVEVLSGGNWATPTAATVNNATCFYNESNVATKPASGQTYTFTPPPPCVAPTSQATGLSLTPGAISASGSFTAAAGSPTGYLVVQTSTSTPPTNPVDGTNYTIGNNPTLGGTVISQGASTTFVSSGLMPSTTYYIWVYAYNSTACLGGPAYQTTSPLTQSFTTTACSPLAAGTYSVGPTGSYPSLSAVSTALANGTAGPTIFELQSTFTSSSETFPIMLSTGACAQTGGVIIRPEAGAVGLSISSNATSTIDINGGANFIIDGRPGGTGTAKQLTISNSSLTGTAVRFINEASGNTLRFVTMTGVNSAAAGAVVTFAGSTGANGNDNNTIDNCDIRDGATTPTNGIYSLGQSSTVTNDNITVSNNNIYNYFQPGNATAGININSFNNSWTVTGNSFYQTATRTSTAGSQHSGIFISNSGIGFSITNNFIGGGAPSCGGSAWNLGGAFANRFVGISVAAGAAATTTVQGNTVTNLTVSTTSGATTTNGTFSGVWVSGGNANIISNTIGATTGTGSISVTTSTGGGLANIISYSGAGILLVQNNSIGAITLLGSTTSVGHGFNGIFVSGGTPTITGNTIGSTSTANSVNSSTVATATQALMGIQVTSAVTTATAISGNTIANINQAGTATGSFVRGIQHSGTGTATIISNTIYNLSGATANTTVSGAATGVSGIVYTGSSASATVSQNTIYSLSATNAGAVSTVVAGIGYSNPTEGLVTRNRIYDLRNASTGTTASSPPMAVGVLLRAGNNVTVANNMISLGNAQSTNTQFVGIMNSFNGTFIAKVYFNSVNIQGTAASGALPSFGFLRGDNSTTAITTPFDIRNNAFTNSRSGGTGKHYAISNNFRATTASTTGWGANASNYNLLNANPANVGHWTTDRTFADWQTASASDANSIGNGTISYTDPATADLHISALPTAIEGVGDPTPILSVAVDYDGQTRASLTPTDIGADAGNFFSYPTINFTPLGNTCNTGARTLVATITDVDGMPTSGAGLPILYWRVGTGSYQAATATFLGSDQYEFSFGATASLGDVVSYYIAAQDNLGNAGTAPSLGASGFTANPPAAATPPSSLPSYALQNTLSGTYTVGASGAAYSTLTAAITAYNNSCISGPVVFLLTDPTYSTSETFPISINANTTASATNTLTIKPAPGVTSAITGSSTNSIIRLNGADFVTIDGSNAAGGTSRDLTISNSNAGTSSVVIMLATANSTDGATNNTIRNVSVLGQAPLTTFVGIYSGSGSNIGASSEAAHNNNQYINNSIARSQYGIAIPGASIGQTGNVVSGNTIGSTTAADYIGFVGSFLSNLNGLQFTGNTIQNIITSANNPVGLSVAANVLNSTFDANTIRSVRYTGTGGYGGKGIAVNTGSATSGLNFTNNMVSDILGDSWSTFTSDAIMGFRIHGATGGINLFNNTINLGSGSFAGNSSGTRSAALYIASTVTNLSLQNNIITTNLVNTTAAAAKSYAIYSDAANTAFSTINYNDYAVSGTQGVLAYIGTDRTTLADIQTGFGQNLRSINVAPSYVSNLDPHLTNLLGDNLCLNGAANPIAGLTTDIDGQTRSTTTPDIGADEFTPTMPTFLVANQAACFGNTVNLTLPAVTAGSTAGQTFTYFTDAACTTALTNASAVSVSGTYYIKATYGTPGCSLEQVLPVTVTINALPTQFTVTGGGSYCSGGSGVAVGLSGSETGINYQLQIGGINTGSPVAGTGSAISFGNQTAAGTYTVVATNATTTCQETMTGSVTVSIDPLPTQYNVTGGGAYCATGSGVAVGLSNSQSGINYQLQIGGVNTGSPVAGTGSAISFGSQTTAGTYTVVATNATTNCQETMSGSATVTIDPLPTQFNVTGGGAYCATGVGTTVGLSGSEAGVDYQLVFNGTTNVGSPVGGTGSAISFGTQTTAGTYTVVATNATTNCQETMTGSATVSINPLPVITNLAVANLTQPTTCISNDGGASPIINGGAPGSYSFNWTGTGIIQGQQNQSALRVGAYSVTVTDGNGCQATATFSLIGPGGCDICPTISTVAADVFGVCQGGTATLTASGLADLGVSYGIAFVSSAVPLVNPYSGTVIATVSNGALTNSGTTAAAAATFNTPGNIYVYAILSPAPADPSCRPFTSTQIEVKATPDVNAVANQVLCAGSQTAAVNFSGSVPGTIYTWSNSNPAIGLAASGTGNISSFTATNFTNAPITATITVTPTNPVLGSRTFNFAGAAETWNVPAGVTSIRIKAWGAQGGDGNYGGYSGFPGKGGYAEGDLAVSPGELLSVLVGGAGQEASVANAAPGANSFFKFGGAGFNGGGYGTYHFSTGTTGGGGGASDVRALGTALSNRVIVAGGGGGSCCLNAGARAGDGGGLVGGNGFNNSSLALGIGGSQSAGGVWTYETQIAGTANIPAIDGILGKGGDAGGLREDNVDVIWSIGGGGGGYYGGSGGYPAGGGSSYIGGVTNALTTPGVRTGDGQVIIDYRIPASICPGPSKTFTITVNPIPTVNTVAPVAACNGASVSVPFSGFVPGTVYEWTNSNTAIGLAASGTGDLSFTGTNTGTAPITATIIVTPKYTNNGQTCTGTPIALTITINPTPTVNAVTNQTLCNNDATTAVTFSGSVTGTVYNWTNDNPSIGLAATGTGNIGSFTAVNTTNSPVTATITVTPSYSNGGTTCTGTATTFTITVTPSPRVNTVSNQTICNNANTAAVNFSTPTTGGTVTYTWTNSNTSIGLAASGTGNIPSFTGVNTGTTPVTATVTVTPSYTIPGGATCTGTPTTFTITVNPTPTVNAVTSQVVCNGASTTATNFSGAVAGTTFSWTNSNTSIGLAASGTGNIASFAAVNTGTTPVTATVTVTPSFTNNGVTCSGTPTSFTITVNPTPTVNTVANQTVCNGANTTAVTFSGAVTGTVYTWSNNTTSIGLGASGTGDIPSFTGVNTTNAPITATITVTPSFTNGGITCNGTPRTFTITVNPTPTVNVVSSQVLCNGSNTTAVNFTGAVAGTVYNWTNNTTSIGLAASGTGNIASFAAVNTGTTPVTATITVTPSYTNNGVTCSGTPTTFTITVNPTPTVNTVANQVVCNGSSTTAVTFTGAVAGTVYTWVNNTPSIGLAANGTATVPSFTAVNTGVVPVVATITVTPTFTSGGITCTGTPRTFTITVNPTPTVNQPANQVVCNRSNTAAVAFTGAVAGTVYNWVNNTPSIGLAASGTGDIAAFAAVNTTQTPVVATITVTPSFTNGGVTCNGTPRTFTITVNPTPIVVATDLFNQRICISDGAIALNATPVGGSWSGIGVSGFNFIPGATAVGNYLLTYSYTNQFACTSTDTTTAKVLACDERNRSLAQGGAILYPNPNGGQFNIRVNSTRFQFLQMRIYNALGQLVSTKQWSGLVYNQVLPIDMRHLAAGVYTVRIIYDGGNLYEDRGYQMLITH